MINYHNFDIDNVREDEQFDEDHIIFDMRKINESLLHRAIKCGISDLVQLLINKGADVSIPCRYTEWKLNAPEYWSDEFKESKIKEKKEIYLKAKQELEEASK